MFITYVLTTRRLPYRLVLIFIPSKYNNKYNNIVSTKKVGRGGLEPPFIKLKVLLLKNSFISICRYYIPFSYLPINSHFIHMLESN